MPHTTSRYGNSDGSEHEESKDSSSRLDISSDAWISRQVLQLEGEGFAGLSALYILAELMRRVGKMEMNAQLFKTKAFSSASSPLFEPLRPLSEDDEQIEINSKVISKYRPCHYFDFISGSGLGGSCAVMLGVMRFTVDEAIRQTELLLTGVVPKFPRDVMSATTSRRAKNSSMLERYLRSSLEEIHKTVPEYQRDTADDATKDTDLFTMCADDYMCQTIVLTTHKERKGIQRPFVFRSYRIGPMSMSRNADDDTTKISLVDACRASLSAPSQFESVKISGLRGSFRDASVTIPNAAHETYHEVLDSSGSRIKFLLCLGLTSPATSTSRTNSPERMSPSNLDKSLATEAKENHFKYHRFADVNLTPSLAGDSQSKIQATKVSAQQYCQEEMNSKALDKWAKRLVKYRRIRAETTQWSDFAGLASRSPTSDLYRSDYFDVASKLNSGQLA